MPCSDSERLFVHTVCRRIASTLPTSVSVPDAARPHGSFEFAPAWCFLAVAAAVVGFWSSHAFDWAARFSK